MVALAAHIDNQRLNILSPFSFTKKEKPSISETFDFFNAKEKSVINKLPVIVKDLKELQEEITTTKLTKKDIKTFYNDSKKLSGGLKYILEIVDKFEIDDKYFNETIVYMREIQKLLSEIKDITEIYIEASKSANDFKHGRTLSHEQVWSALGV